MVFQAAQKLDLLLLLVQTKIERATDSGMYWGNIASWNVNDYGERFMNRYNLPRPVIDSTIFISTSRRGKPYQTHIVLINSVDLHDPNVFTHMAVNINTPGHNIIVKFSANMRYTEINDWRYLRGNLRAHHCLQFAIYAGQYQSILYEYYSHVYLT